MLYRKDFDYTAECGIEECQNCGYVYYPMEVEDNECPACLGHTINRVINNNPYNGTELVVLLADDGEIFKQNGMAIEGVGICNENDEWFCCGWDEDGVCFACNVDTDNTVLNQEGSRLPYKIGEITTF